MIFLFEGLPNVSQNCKEIKHQTDIQVSIPAGQPLMIEIIDKTFICVSFQIYGESLVALRFTVI